jgi:hypothetical protein
MILSSFETTVTTLASLNGQTQIRCILAVDEISEDTPPFLALQIHVSSYFLYFAEFATHSWLLQTNRACSGPIKVDHSSRTVFWIPCRFQEPKQVVTLRHWPLCFRPLLDDTSEYYLLSISKLSTLFEGSWFIGPRVSFNKLFLKTICFFIRNYNICSCLPEHSYCFHVNRRVRVFIYFFSEISEPT